MMAANPARADSPAPAPSTGESDEYSEVTCTSTNAGVNADILQMANDVRDQLGSVLKLGPKWRFDVHLHIVMPDDPVATKIREEHASVTASGKTMTLEAAAPFYDPDLKAFVQRQFVTALLWEKFFADSTSFDSHTNLAVVPVWLIEGLTEWINEDAGRDREGIVRRATTIDRAPTLAEVTGWEEISQDRLLGLYQRAFCYYLVDSLLHGETQRARFQNWLATFAGNNPAQAAQLFPTEAVWQQQLLEASSRSHDIVYTWDESATAFSDAQTITIPSANPKDARTCTLDSVASVPRDDKLVAALQKKVFDLTALELRAHPSWRPILALYRFGLTAEINNNPTEAQGYFVEAQHRRRVEADYHQKLTDYVNWFEVTKNFKGRGPHYESYFSTAREMKEMQADPARPNPIRADLLHVESQL